MYNNNTIVPYISLCSGYEGIGLGLHRCIPSLRAVAYCEREAFACANLVAKMENGLLDAAPIFTDVTTFPWADYAPYMAGGILSFGWPCQPVSCAGKRQATEDERWLFDIIADGISILKPGMLFAENVEGLLSAKMPDGSSVFGHCIQRLESLHYKVAAGIFSASEVGAPHQRKRVFILAVSSSFGGAAGLPRLLAWNEGFAGVTDNGGGEGCGELENPECIRWRGWNQGGAEIRECRSTKDQVERPCSLASSAVWPSRPGEPQHGWEPPRVVDSTSARQQAQRDESNGKRQEGFACESSELGNADHGRLASSLNARSGTEADRGGQSDIEQAEPRKAQPSLGRDPHGSADWMDYAELQVSCDNRTDELRLLGNGVVPATAERAFRTLIKELL